MVSVFVLFSRGTSSMSQGGRRELAWFSQNICFRFSKWVQCTVVCAAEIYAEVYAGKMRIHRTAIRVRRLYTSDSAAL